MKDYHKAQLGAYGSILLVVLSYAILLFDSAPRISFWYSGIIVLIATVLITLWERQPQAVQYLEAVKVFRENYRYEEAGH